jgi:hypothetical protein
MMEINCHSFLLYPAKVLRKIGIIMEDKEKESIITQAKARTITSLNTPPKKPLPGPLRRERENN